MDIEYCWQLADFVSRQISNGHTSTTVHPIHIMFGFGCSFWNRLIIVVEYNFILLPSYTFLVFAVRLNVSVYLPCFADCQCSRESDGAGTATECRLHSEQSSDQDFTGSCCLLSDRFPAGHQPVCCWENCALSGDHQGFFHQGSLFCWGDIRHYSPCMEWWLLAKVQHVNNVYVL